MADSDCVPPTGQPLVGRVVRLAPMKRSDVAGLVDVGREQVYLGSTMYGSRWRGTSVNPDCKRLLLGHAFATCGFGRVKI